MSIQWSIEEYEAVPSTQDLVKQKAASSDEGLVVRAFQQTDGRGRHGREWVSQDGNLFFSFLLRPQSGVETIGQLGLVIGTALGAALKNALDDPSRLSLKWPNDILLDGKKCAGILIETELSNSGALEWVVVGVGINVKAAPDEQAIALGADVSLDQILEQVSAFYTQWQTQGFAAIQPLWLDMAHSKGAPVTVKLGNQLIEGLFEGVDEQGALLLQDSGTDELRTITAGDVYV